ncbi:serine/threonine-protein kinase [Goodfellowiella coeruleoviolacea]|nr:serine/threonine-protein kinase [Goodfellowiella coeruleoviolacea]
MPACDRPGCTGVIDQTGFCDRCGRRPPREARSPSSPRIGARGRGRGSWVSGDLLSPPVLDLPAPESQVGRTLLRVDRQVCGECGRPAGRGYRGQPALTEGYCEHCGARFSFSLKLREGDLVDGRYEVVGPLSRGGMGWVYLARARRLNDIHVVLKGLINTEDRTARRFADNERLALISLDHPNIVRILDFVSHPDPVSGNPTEYIVMEYVGGPTLSELKTGSAWPGHGPLTVDLAITYVLEILAALDYLHGEGLLHCDVKPANAIRTANRVKVIDLGAVREIGDRHSAVVGTRDYQVPAEEISEHGLTVGSDLYTVGRTLEVLVQVAEEVRGQRSGSGAIAVGLDSLRQVIKRATAPIEHRFTSAAEMSTQLKGVLREIVGLRGRTVRPVSSTVFEDPVVLLDAGLGSVPPLSRWTGVPLATTAPVNQPPAPAAVVAGLPAPRVHPADPAADLLARTGAASPSSLIRVLAEGRDDPSAVVASVEVPLVDCRAHAAVADLPGASARLAEAERLLGAGGAHDWRLAWHRGLVALAAGDTGAAEAHFVEVYQALPGEQVPKLVLGLCREILGRAEAAEHCYRAVWAGDPAQVSAAFGLARIRLGRGDRAGAVAILGSVPTTSRHSAAARIAAVRVLCGRISPADGADPVLPTAAHFAEAGRRLAALGLDEDPEVRLRASAHEVALDQIRAGGQVLPDGVLFAAVPATPPRRGLRARVRRRWPARVRATSPASPTSPSGTAGTAGTADRAPVAPLTERRVRELLEELYGRLAEQAHNPDDHGVLIDRANAVRPTTWW